MKKKIMTFIIALLIGFSTSLTVFAEWKQDANGNWSWIKNGSKQIGWVQIRSNWYYFNSHGNMISGWQYIDNHWYYFNSDGKMQIGWQPIDGAWYYFTNEGYMVTGWISEKADFRDPYYETYWYYLLPNGKMATGWQMINGKSYFFYSDGKMAADTIIDGYFFDTSGIAMLIKRKDTDKNYTSIDDLINKWNCEYKKVDTPLGTATFNFEYSYNTSTLVGYDYRIYTGWSGIDVYDLCYSNQYTKTQKQETAQILRDIQLNLALDIAQYLPSKKVIGGFHYGSYKYPALQLRYQAFRLLTWQNYSGPLSGDPKYYEVNKIYEYSYVDKFHWIPYMDDYNLFEIQ